MHRRQTAMNKGNDNKFTVQGRDTPVPVGDRGGREGLDRPSASDFSASPVVHQAGKATSATGTNESDDEVLAPWRPMEKRLSCNTSPPWSAGQQPQAVPTPTRTAYIDLRWDDEEGKSIKKRKREKALSDPGRDLMEQHKETDAAKAKLKRAKQLIKGIEDSTRELAKLVNHNVNTKKEIKEVASKLRALSSQLNTVEMWNLINSLKITEALDDSRVTPVEEASTQTKASSLRDVSTQTEYYQPLEGRSVDSKGCQTDSTKDHTGRLSQLIETEDPNEIMDIINKNWYENWYHKTRPGIGNPLEQTKNTIFMIDPEEKDYNWLKQKIYEYHPQIKTHLNNGKLAAGKIIQISTAVTLDDNEEENEQKTDYILGIKSPLSTESTQENAENWFSILKGIRQLLDKDPITREQNVILCNATNTDIDKIRKLSEKALHNTNITMTIYSKDHREKRKVTNLTNNSANMDTASTTIEPFSWTKRNNKKRNTLVIKGVTNEKYADVLKNLKKEINVTELGVKVDNIIHNADDEIQIKYYADEESETKFMAEIKRNTEEHVKTSIKRPHKTVFIKDLNCTTGKEEIMEALISELKINKNEIYDIEMAKKPNRNNLLYSFVKIPIDKANELLQQRKLRCGWQLCRVEETNKPTICYNCYKYGHIATACTADKKEKRCLNCSATNHGVKECKEEAKCINCTNNDKHNTYSFACPLYKKAIREMRENRRT